jgi:branched-chain amino acid transport system ATP-binding protein
MAEEVTAVIRGLRDQGVTVLLVEQNVYGALQVASRAFVLETGKVVAADDSASLLGNKELLRAYLGG